MYYSTEHDSDYDDEDEISEFAEATQYDRTEPVPSYNDLCRINGVLDKCYSKLTLEKARVRRNVFLTLCISSLLEGLSL